MKDYSSKFPIEKMCKTLKVSRSSYYHWSKRRFNRRDIENKDLSDKIRMIYEKNEPEKHHKEEVCCYN
jgi:hypothetical protein